MADEPDSLMTRIGGSWRSSLRDVVLIVVSILIAFSLEAWWDGQQEEARETEVLAALEAGFIEHRQLAARSVDLLDADWGLLQRFIQMSPEEASEIPADSAFLFLQALWRPRIGELNSVALRAVADVGRSSVLAEAGLQTAIANWEATVERLEERDMEMAASERAVLEVMTRHPEIQSAFGTTSEPSLDGAVARRIREDPEVMSRAAHKSFVTRITVLVLERLMARSDSVLVLVRSMSQD